MENKDFVEITLRLKDDEQTLVKKHPVYSENFSLSHDNPELRKLVDQAIQDFTGTPTDILVKAKYTW